MDRMFKWKVLLIIAVVAFSIWKAYPPQEKINLGLDLQGGMQLLLQVELDKVPQEARDDAADRAVEIIRNRIDEFGVLEPAISKQGKDKIVVQLPGVTDRERAIEIVGRTAHLEFRLVSDDGELLKQAEAGTIPEGYEYSELKNEGLNTEKILLEKASKIGGDHLTNASVGFDQYGQAIVQLQFDDEGAKLFDDLTFKNIGKRLAIVLDSTVHSAPVIRDRIPNGQAQISGNFSPEEASDLALVLRAGALPAPVTIIEERTVGPSLGRDSIQKGIKAGFFGTFFVFLFMPAYYLLCGFIADIGLIVYVIMVVGSLAMLGSSLTLPGIAGFILSVGMAVDANILVSERIREELETGKTPRAAISAGYHRAFAAILDSNVAVFITSVILFFMGTGPIKGFAVTLGLGQIASMFSSLTVTRVVFDFLAHKDPHVNLKMMKFLGVTHIPFLKGRFWAYGFSVLTIVLGIAAFFMRGSENYGVEFTGGTLVQVRFNSVVEINHLRNALEKQEVRGAIIQHYGNPSENEFVIKYSEKDTKKVENAAAKVAPSPASFEITRVEHVGPVVSQDLRKKALWAVFWSCLGIMIYLGVRFQWKYALAAVIALLHDTIFSFGIYALTGREINLATIAAVLTILGYSVNDTIVNFDRIRENLRTMRKKSFQEIVDLSVNQMLGRTLLSSLNVIFGAAALFFFGGSGIQDFAFFLLIGFTVGVYSSIFVSNALVVDWKAK